MLICSVLCFSWSRYGNILCSSVNKLQQNYIMYSTKIDCFVEDSLGLHFYLCDRLSFVRQPKQ